MENKNKDVWLYSYDGQYFNSNEYKSKDDAIKNAQKEGIKGCVYIAKKKEGIYIPCLDGDAILKSVQYKMDNECGEFGDGWIIGIRKEDKKIIEDRLNDVFCDWISEFDYGLRWYKAVDVEKIELNEVINKF